jgi:hypothetical protein
MLQRPLQANPFTTSQLQPTPPPPPKGLEDQLLALVVNKERPDLEETKTQLIIQNTEFTIKLKQLEDELLYKLSTAEGDITGGWRVGLVYLAASLQLWERGEEVAAQPRSRPTVSDRTCTCAPCEACAALTQAPSAPPRLLPPIFRPNRGPGPH